MPAAAKNTKAVRPGYLFLICPDTQVMLEKINEEVHKFEASSSFPIKRASFWGFEEPDSSFNAAMTTRDLFGTATLVLVRQAHLWPADTWNMVDRLLSRQWGDNFPIFCIENEWKKGKPQIPAIISKKQCYKFAEKKGWTWLDQGITDKNISAYIVKTAKEKKIDLAPATVKKLHEDMPRQAGIIMQELDKLALLSSGTGPVQPELLGTAKWSSELNMYPCVTAIFNGNDKAAWKDLPKIQDTEEVMGFLGLVTWYIRNLWQILAGEPAGNNYLDRNLAARIGYAGLAKAMSLVVDAEEGIKTGTPPRQAIEFLAMRLLTLFRR